MQELPVQEQESVQEPEKQELKIGLGSKRSSGEKLLVKVLLPSSAPAAGNARAASRRSAAARFRRRLPPRLKRWSGSRCSSIAAREETQFRRVRICIVQREETLDSIADRYQLQAREIAQYNRLADQGLVQGQVLYIP